MKTCPHCGLITTPARSYKLRRRFIEQADETNRDGAARFGVAWLTGNQAAVRALHLLWPLGITAESPFLKALAMAIVFQILAVLYQDRKEE